MICIWAGDYRGVFNAGNELFSIAGSSPKKATTKSKVTETIAEKCLALNLKHTIYSVAIITLFLLKDSQRCMNIIEDYVAGS